MTDDFMPTCPPLHEMTRGLALVIDDVEVNRILARAHLEMLGWRVDECDSGIRAIHYLRNALPQAMLVDIRMPGISGDEFVRHIRDVVGPEVLLVGYTAHSMQDDIRNFLACGFDHVLVKPVSLSDMRAVLSRPAIGD